MAGARVWRHRHCPGEEKRLKNDTCEQMSIERGRYDLERIEKQYLSRRVSVKEGRSRMVETPSGIVAVKFVEHLCFPDLQGVGRKVAAFVVRLFEVEAQMTSDQQSGDARPDHEESRPPLARAAACGGGEGCSIMQASVTPCIGGASIRKEPDLGRVELHLAKLIARYAVSSVQGNYDRANQAASARLRDRWNCVRKGIARDHSLENY